MKGYYFITDQALSRNGNAFDVTAANEAGVPMVQYREKQLPSGAMFAEAMILKRLCTKSRFIVNDRVDIALAVDADGLHIGAEDLPLPVARRLLGKTRLIGVSVRTTQEAADAETAGADYVGVGPIFATATKADAGQPLGVELVAAVRRAVKIPVVAIGGITLANAPAVIAAGADMICAISAVVAAQDPKHAMLQFGGIFL